MELCQSKLNWVAYFRVSKRSANYVSRSFGSMKTLCILRP